MIVYLKGSEIALECAIDPAQFADLVTLTEAGVIYCSVSVRFGERVGAIPMADLDIMRTLEFLKVEPYQMAISWPLDT